ncbi:MAG: hypothetical protein WBG86_02455, partial [Polyangiales bacterium]
MSRNAALLAGGFVCAVLLPAPESKAFCRVTTTTDPNQQACATDGVPLEWRRRCISFSVDARGSQTMAFDDVVDAID